MDPALGRAIRIFATSVVSPHAPFYAALMMAVVATIIVAIGYLGLPRRRLRRLEQELLAASIRASTPTTGSPRITAPLVRELFVPVPLASFKERLLQRLAATEDLEIPSVKADILTVTGRPRRFLNVNHVHPRDFSLAEFHFERPSDSECRITYQVQFAGFGRVPVVVGLFTAFAAVIMCIGPGNRANFFSVMAVLLAFDVFFVVVRYKSQLLATQRFFDGLVLETATH